MNPTALHIAQSESDCRFTGMNITRETLHEAVWKTPLTHLAKSYGIPVSVLTKACDQFDIPRPAPDYWPRRRLGYQTEITPLPPAPIETPASIELKWTPKTGGVKTKQPQPGSSQPLPPPIETAPTGSRLQIAQNFRRAHPVVRRAREQLEKGKADYKNGLIHPANWREPCANIFVSKEQLRRALLILDAVLHAFNSTETDDAGIQIGEEFIHLKIREQTKRYLNPGKEGDDKSHIWPRHLFKPTGILIFYINEYYFAKQWSDKKTRPLENSLDDIVEGIKQTAEELHLRNIEWAEAEKRRKEEERKYYELQKLREKELARRRSLENQSDLWDKASRLRAFIEACRHHLANRGALAPESTAHRWLDWAAHHADRLDPLRNQYLENAIKNLPPEIVEIPPDEDEGDDSSD